MNTKFKSFGLGGLVLIVALCVACGGGGSSDSSGGGGAEPATSAPATPAAPASTPAASSDARVRRKRPSFSRRRGQGSTLTEWAPRTAGTVSSRWAGTVK